MDYSNKISKEKLEDIIIIAGKKLELSNETIENIALFTYKKATWQIEMARWLTQKIESGEKVSDQEVRKALDDIISLR